MEAYFENDLITLYNGDCIEVMNEMASNGIKVDKIITSPPYGVRRTTFRDDQTFYDSYTDELKDTHNYIDWTIDIFNCYDKVLNKNGCILYNISYGSENTELMPLTVSAIIERTDFTLADILIWKKPVALPNNMASNKFTRICEFVYVFCRRSEFGTFTANKKIKSYSSIGQPFYENVYNFFEASNNDTAQNLNKCTFSTDFVYNLIRMYVRDTDVVLDNFSGTGTTVYACQQRGIKSIGIELSKDQCDYTVNRVSGGTPTLLW